MSSVTPNHTITGDVPEDIARIAEVMATYPGPMVPLRRLGRRRLARPHLARPRRHRPLRLRRRPARPLRPPAAAGNCSRTTQRGQPRRRRSCGGTARRHLGDPSHIHARPPERAGDSPRERHRDRPRTASSSTSRSTPARATMGAARRPEDHACPFDRAVRTSPWGMPTASPEVLLFFKARDLRRRDKTDFAALLPLLTTRPARVAARRDRDARASVGEGARRVSVD